MDIIKREKSGITAYEQVFIKLADQEVQFSVAAEYDYDDQGKLILVPDTIEAGAMEALPDGFCQRSHERELEILAPSFLPKQLNLTE